LSQDEYRIGRDTTNDITISDPEISRKHARLTLQPGGFQIEDLGSTNGTFVNGMRLMGPHALRPGELILLGENVALVYDSGQFDPDATVIAEPSQETGIPISSPEPVPEFIQPPSQQVQPSQPPAYSGQVPESPVEISQQPAPVKSRSTRTWLLAGCGCLVIIAIGVIAALFVIDILNLWCTLFGSLIAGCAT
jgi:predicted component of type VI protein secretion system